MPECLGDAALYIDSGGPAERRAELERVLQDEGLRHRIGKKGVARAELLTWESSAKRVMAIFNEL